MVVIDQDYLSILQIKNRTLKQIMDKVNSIYQLEGDLSLTGDFN